MTPFMPAFMPEVPEASIGNTGIVEPHVHARHEPPREMQVVALHEQDLALELRHAPHARDGADELLPGLVGGMRLAREDEDDRALRVAEHAAAARRDR